MRVISRHPVALLPLAIVSVLTLSPPPVAGQTRIERPAGARPIRLAKPRVEPLPDAQWTDVHRGLIAKYLSSGERPGNAFRTLLHIPALVDSIMELQNYLTRDSSLDARHREILILRTAWLHGNEYLWSQHAPIAMKAGLSADDLRRVAQGADTPGWAPIEAELLRLADQLVRNSFVNDATWKRLSASYDMFHMLDAVMTVTQFTTESLLYNAWGVQPDDWASAASRMPTDVPYRVMVPERGPALETARIEPLPGTGLAITRTFARYPKLAAARTGSGYVNRGSKLEPRYREMMILRTGWNCQSEYEWAQHVGSVGRAREHGLDPVRIAQGAAAPGWDPFEQTLLRAADELYRDSIVSDPTWNQLAARFDNTMITNVIISAANYRMVSMALNALGVALDPGDEGFPKLP
jgi:alkylhydroperoxidase family enzyme